ncbi:MAG: dihydroorotate dehydrogenase [Roseburia intestinalis]
MMEERKQNEKLVKVEMIELTEEEKECMKLLDEKLAKWKQELILWCACVN